MKTAENWFYAWPYAWPSQGASNSEVLSFIRAIQQDAALSSGRLPDCDICHKPQKTKGKLLLEIGVPDVDGKFTGRKLHAHEECEFFQSSSWLDISSAPKDGTWILAYSKDVPISNYPLVVFYDEGVYSNPRAWATVKSDDYGREEVYPTHWLPLPKPPANEDRP